MSKTKINHKNNSQQKRSLVKLAFAHLGWLPLTILLILGQRYLSQKQAWTEKYYSGKIFPIISWPLLRLSSLATFSLTELFVFVLLPLLVIISLVYGLIKIIKNKGSRLKITIKGFTLFFWFLFVLLLIFMLLHGFNYARQPAAALFDLPTKARTTAELKRAGLWLTQELTALRVDLPQDEQGVFCLSQDLDQTMKDVNQAYAVASLSWPQLKGYKIRPKSVYMSHYWSYTGITGIYNPFFVEANVNTDQPAYALPDTIAHEVAHTRGFAREDEANFVAFLVGEYGDNPDYRYSSLLSTWIRLTNQLYTYDREAYDDLAAALSEEVRRDLTAGYHYWQQFEGPVQEASTKTNNLYLQANMQTDGVRSYGRMLDLFLAWFLQEEPDLLVGAE